jgi:hypothetical protein
VGLFTKRRVLCQLDSEKPQIKKPQIGEMEGTSLRVMVLGEVAFAMIRCSGPVG